MKLSEIAFRSIVVISLYVYAVIIVREPFDPLVPPYGLIVMLFAVTFWAIIWAIGPKDWWD